MLEKAGLVLEKMIQDFRERLGDNKKLGAFCRKWIVLEQLSRPCFLTFLFAKFPRSLNFLNLLILEGPGYLPREKNLAHCTLKMFLATFSVLLFVDS